IATVWAEYVSVGSGGRWFCLESLDPLHLPGGGKRSANQTQRATNRLALLKQTFEAKRGFRAVLQTNRVPIAEVETSKSAKVSTRVRDEHEWHVASWEPDRQLAVLVRGARDWAPTESEIQAASTRSPVLQADGSHSLPSGPATPEALHAAAVAYVKRHFGGYGYKPEDLTGRGLGYDIEVSNAKGATLLRVAVKGTSTALPGVRLTPDQQAAAARDDLWRLLVVTDALTSTAQHKIYKPSEMAQAPGFEPQA
ncbi:MAG: DUF3883 domain-containing protein, partial [Comamonadaceae bacterium]